MLRFYAPFGPIGRILQRIYVLDIAPVPKLVNRIRLTAFGSKFTAHFRRTAARPIKGVDAEFFKFERQARE